MEKKEKIEDFEFVDNPDSTLEPVEEIQNDQADEETGKIEEEETEDSDSAETASQEEERITRAEKLFGSYPETFSLISGNKDIRIDDKMENFMATVVGFARGSKVSSKEIDSALSMLFNISTVGSNGSPTLDMLEVLMKGLSYDRKMAEEIHAAELRGRNANIEAKMRSRTVSDGVPHLESRGSGSEKRNRGIFSLAEKARR